MQHMLFGEPDGPEHLMRDARAFGRRLGTTDFRRSDLQKDRVINFSGLRHGIRG